MFDYKALAESRPTQYLQSGGQVPPLFAAMFRWYPFIEASVDYLYSVATIDAATGIDLDLLGEYAGVPRNGRNDEDYRIAIRMALVMRSGSGTPPDVMSFISYTFGANKQVMTERAWASHNLHINDDVFIPIDIDDQLDRVSVAGVSAHVTFSRGIGESFWFSGINRDTAVLGHNGVTDGAIGINTDKVLAINGSDPLGGENLTGIISDPIYFALAVNGKALGQNGQPSKVIGVNGSIPAGQVWDRGIYLAGAYG